MSEPLYTATWRRNGETEWLTCHKITLRELVARGMNATRHGLIEVIRIELTNESEPASVQF